MGRWADYEQERIVPPDCPKNPRQEKARILVDLLLSSVYNKTASERSDANDVLVLPVPLDNYIRFRRLGGSALAVV